MRAFIILLIISLGGCAVPTNQVGDMIPGRIISLSKGTLLPMQIQLSYGSGKMTAIFCHEIAHAKIEATETLAFYSDQNFPPFQHP